MSVDSRLFIALAGPPGSGKTSLAHLLKADLSATLALERDFFNPFVSLVHKERIKFDLASQVSFTMARYYQYQVSIPDCLASGNVISDHIFETSLAFARMGLGGDDLSAFLPLYNRLHELCFSPNVVIFLRASPRILLKRLQSRDESTTWSLDSLIVLDREYVTIMNGMSKTRTLVIDTEIVDIRSPSTLSALVEQVMLLAKHS